MSETFAPRALGDIAATLPGATAVFRRAKLDFCCGGAVSLAEAASAKGVSLATLEDELAGLVASPRPSTLPEDVDGLVDYIVTRYHEAHRRDLPELIRLAKRVAVAHADHPAVPASAARVLEELSGELSAHLAKEEQVLFPMMKRGGHPMISGPIAVMLSEHDAAGALLHQLEEMTHDFTLPAEGTCPTWKALYAGLRKFADELMEHIHIENHVLFPLFS